MEIVKNHLIAFVFLSFCFLGISCISVSAQVPPIREQSVQQLPLLGEKNYDSIIQRNVIKDIVDASHEESSDSILRKLFTRQEDGRSPIVIANVIIGVFAFLFLLVIATQFLFAGGEEESMSKAKTNIGWLLLGLGVVSVAEFVAFTLLDPAQESTRPLLLSDTTADLLSDKIEQIIDYVEILITGVMLVFLGLSGYNILTSGDGGEEKLEEEKKFAKTFFLGAALILLAESIVLIFSNTHPQDAIFKGENEILGFINYILSFVGVTAFVMLILSAFYWVTSFGQDDQMERAKKMILGCVLGIVVAISSYVIASFMIR